MDQCLPYPRRLILDWNIIPIDHRQIIHNAHNNWYDTRDANNYPDNDCISNEYSCCNTTPYKRDYILPTTSNFNPQATTCKYLYRNIYLNFCINFHNHSDI